jgi:hypothetical protein
MRINIWIILATLLALLVITRYLQHNRDTERICADDPSALVCQRWEASNSNRGKWPMGKIKFEGNPPYALPIVQNVMARAEGAAVELTLDVIASGKEPSLVPIKVQMMVDSARSLRAQLQPAITMAELHQRR